MVDEQIGRDLLSFGKPILVLGDPAQLPPVKNECGFFTNVEPEVMLTEVHRQAAENPIIALSMHVRQGGTLSYGAWGTVRIVSINQLAGVDQERPKSSSEQMPRGGRITALYAARLVWLPSCRWRATRLFAAGMSMIDSYGTDPSGA
jgi:hypothetical protein